MKGERVLLEASLAACKRRLDIARRMQNQLEESLLESDLNTILERLAEIYRGVK